ncbi:MAG: putative DNA binding domain-containing protein [Muribaculaceae bacterium]|nr:putative DNA binding domain-containing protein [Muribaculaceae bacterium]
MTIDDIKALIASDESRTLELKKSTGELKDGMQTACAFLNTDGGWLIFGVTPKSLKIIGQQVTDDTKREISQALTGIEPAYDIQPIYVDVPEHPGNKVIAFHFDGWKRGEYPYTFRGRPYYKIESTTKIMPREMYDERIMAYQPQSYSWEMVPAKDVSLSDLDKQKILGCIRLGVDGGRIPMSALTAPIEDTLAKWKLIINGVPTNGAAILFSNNIISFDNFQLRLARFRGNDKLEFIDNQRAEGNFFDLLDAGMAFLFKHLNLSGKITNKSLMREEQLEVPVKALREALINALCHRQWEKQNLTISIAVYDDRVEIANPGIFPPQIQIENIKESHESYPYNHNMAQALYRSTFLESWGSGIHRIIEACREQGVEEPTWRWDGGFVYVTFKRPIKYRPTTDQVPPNYPSSSPQVRLKFAPSSPQVIQLIQAMEDQNYSIRELAGMCGFSDPKHFRESYINQAIAEKAIERLYPDQPNHPKQKYHLTDGAKEWKDSIV